MSIGGRWHPLVRSQTPGISGRGGPGRPGNHSKRRDLSMFPGPCPGYYVFCTLVVFSQAVPHVSGKRWPCGFARARQGTPLGLQEGKHPLDNATGDDFALVHVARRI